MRTMRRVRAAGGSNSRTPRMRSASTAPEMRSCSPIQDRFTGSGWTTRARSAPSSTWAWRPTPSSCTRESGADCSSSSARATSTPLGRTSSTASLPRRRRRPTGWPRGRTRGCTWPTAARHTRCCPSPRKAAAPPSTSRCLLRPARAAARPNSGGRPGRAATSSTSGTTARSSSSFPRESTRHRALPVSPAGAAPGAGGRGSSGEEDVMAPRVPAEGSRLAVDGLLELGDLIDLGAHGDVGGSLGDHLHDDREAIRSRERAGLFEGGGELVRLEDAHREAAERLRRLDVIDPVLADRGRVHVVEAELDFVVHLVAALGLADEAQIGVVEEHDDERNVVLRGHRQLLDEELEGIVADDSHHFRVRVGELGADASGDFPAERSGLAADEVLARPVDALELPGGDLVEPDGGDESRFVAEDPVDLLEHPLGLDGNVIEIGAAMQDGLALSYLGNPGGSHRQRAPPRALAC